MQFNVDETDTDRDIDSNLDVDDANRESVREHKNIHDRE
jgi:hypothetical protein